MRKLSLLSALFVSASCNSLNQFCEKENHPFFEQTQVALAALTPNRSIAALAEKNEPNPFKDYTLDDWTDWTTARLAEVQKIVDVTQDEPNLHEVTRELMAASNDLMRFQGSLQRSPRKNLSRADHLKHAIDNARAAKAHACAQRKPMLK